MPVYSHFAIISSTPFITFFAILFYLLAYGSNRLLQTFIYHSLCGLQHALKIYAAVNGQFCQVISLLNEREVHVAI